MSTNIDNKKDSFHKMFLSVVHFSFNYLCYTVVKNPCLEKLFITYFIVSSLNRYELLPMSAINKFTRRFAPYLYFADTFEFLFNYYQTNQTGGEFVNIEELLAEEKRKEEAMFSKLNDTFSTFSKPDDGVNVVDNENKVVDKVVDNDGLVKDDVIKLLKIEDSSKVNYIGELCDIFKNISTTDGGKDYLDRLKEDFKMEKEICSDVENCFKTGHCTKSDKDCGIGKDE